MPQSDKRIGTVSVERCRRQAFGARVNGRLVLPLLFVLIAALSTSGQDRRAIISGRVVNQKGRPIQDADVTLYISPAAGAFELILPSAESGPGGEFFIDSGSISPSKKLRLFIEEPPPIGFWSPLNGPPFGKLSRLPALRGIPITIKPNQARVDLGDIQPGIRYAKIVLDLTRTWPEINQPVGHGLIVAIGDDLGHVVYDGRVPDSAIDLTSSSFKLALPKGKWSIALSFVRDSKIVKSPRRIIKVTTPSCLNVALTAKRPASPCH